MRQFFKTSAANLDWTFDWSVWLSSNETIATSVFTVDPGITVGVTSNDATTATIWLSGGTAGTSYKVKNTITTNAARTDERTVAMVVVSNE